MDCTIVEATVIEPALLAVVERRRLPEAGARDGGIKLQAQVVDVLV